MPKYQVMYWEQIQFDCSLIINAKDEQEAESIVLYGKRKLTTEEKESIEKIENEAVANGLTNIIKFG